MNNQCVLLPKGCTTSIPQNDKGIVNICGIAEELRRVMEPWRMPSGVLHALCGDDIYDIFITIVKKMPNNEHLF
jgi:hypothetical protein